MSNAAAPKKSFRKRYVCVVGEPGWNAEGLDDTDGSFAGQDDVRSQRMVARATDQATGEAARRSKSSCGQSEINSVVYAAMSVCLVVAPVLHIAYGEHSDPHRLKKLRDQQRGNHNIAGAHPPIREPHQNAAGFRELL